MKATLECQQCGVTVRALTPSEQQRVARDPYNFIVYCLDCEPEVAAGGER